MKLVIPIEPMGTVRTTAGMIKRIKYYAANDKKAEAVKRYLAYKQELSLRATAQFKSTIITGPVRLNIVFRMPMPESWTGAKKKRMNGQPHTTKPDRDNLEKGVCDSLNKIIWKDDGQVFDGSTSKYYSFEPGIEIEITEVSA